jgi:hypothetical protein
VKDPLKYTPDLKAPSLVQTVPLPGGGHSVVAAPTGPAQDLYNADQKRAAGVADIKSSLLSIIHAADMLEGTDLFGPGGQVNRDKMNLWTASLRQFGVEPSKEVQTKQEALDILDKATINLQLQLGGSVGGGAESTIQTAHGGVPSTANTLPGLRSILSSLWQRYQRYQDVVTYKDAYRAKFGSYVGAQDAFDRAYTPESYQKAAQFDLIKPQGSTWQALKTDYAKNHHLSADDRAKVDAALGNGMAGYVEQMLRDGIEPQPY